MSLGTASHASGLHSIGIRTTWAAANALIVTKPRFGGQSTIT
jgi:hypothetical protein